MAIHTQSESPVLGSYLAPDRNSQTKHDENILFASCIDIIIILGLLLIVFIYVMIRLPRRSKSDGDLKR
jgi:hypothetical protein